MFKAKFKRATAIVMAGTLAFSMIGCGSSKDKSSKKKKVDVSKVSSMGEAVEKIGDYTKGNYEYSFKLNSESSDGGGTLEFSGDGKLDGKNFTVDTISFKAKTDDANQKIEFSDLLTLVDGRAYINLDSIIKEFSDVDTEFGAYGLLLPDTEKSDKFKKDFFSLCQGAVDAFIEGAEVKGNKDASFTAVIDDSEGYKKAFDSLFDWIDDNQDNISSTLQSLTDVVDVKDYVKKLFDDIDEDLIDAAEVLGFDQYVNETVIEGAKSKIDESLEEIDFEEPDFSDLFKGFDKAKADIQSKTVEDWDKMLMGMDKKDIEVSVTMEEEKYEVSFSAEFEGDGAKITAEGKFTLNLDDVSIKAPKNKSSLKEIAEYAKENPQVLQDVSAGFTKYANNAKDVIAFDFNEDSWDDDDDDDDDWDDESSSSDDDESSADDDESSSADDDESSADDDESSSADDESSSADDESSSADDESSSADDESSSADDESSSADDESSSADDDKKDEANGRKTMEFSDGQKITFFWDADAFKLYSSTSSMFVIADSSYSNAVSVQASNLSKFSSLDAIAEASGFEKVKVAGRDAFKYGVNGSYAYYFGVDGFDGVVIMAMQLNSDYTEDDIVSMIIGSAVAEK